MKRIEIIIPHRKLEAAHEILKNVNAGGMSYYKIEGAGNIKAELNRWKRNSESTSVACSEN